MTRTNKHCEKILEILNKNYRSTNLIKFTFAIIAIAFMAQVYFAVPAAAAETNLVANPGFENGSTFLSSWGLLTRNGNIPIWDTVSHSGSKSIKISVPGTTSIDSGIVVSKFISVKPGQYYTFSAWVKTQSTAGANPPVVKVVEADANTRWLRETTLTFGKGTYAWSQQIKDFQTGANTAILYVTAGIPNGYGTIWVDDVSLSLKGATSTPTPTPTPAPTYTPPTSSGTNYVLNPSFESGTTAPLNWKLVSTNGNTPTWETVPHTGSRSIKISIPGTTSGYSGKAVSDFINVKPGQYYTVSAWIKTQSTGGANAPIVRFVETDAKTNWLRQTILTFGMGTTSWSQQLKDVQTGSNTAYIYIVAEIPNGYGTFWVDDVSLSLKGATSTPTPTPTSAPLPNIQPTPTPIPTSAPLPNIQPTPTPTPTSCTQFVAKNGNDANPGTELLPWLTIQKAANTAVAGNTVCVKAGKYNERLIPKNSGSAGKWITFSAAPGTARDTVIIDGTGLKIPLDEGLVYINGKNYIKVSGFRIQYTKGSGANQGNGIVVIGLTTSYSHITIEMNHLYDIYGSGINALGTGNNLIINRNELEMIGNRPHGIWGQEQLSVGGGADIVTVSNNRVHHNAYWYYGIDGCSSPCTGGTSDLGVEALVIKDGTTNAEIFGNEIDHQDNEYEWQTGIYIGTTTGHVKNIRVYNNIIHDIRGNAFGLTSEQGGLMEDISFYNNIAYRGNDVTLDSTKYGYRLVNNHMNEYGKSNEGVIKNVMVINNIAYGFRFSGMSLGESELGENIVARNNILSSNANQLGFNPVNTAADHNLFYGATSQTGTDYVVGDPKFINPASANFRLQSDSPAINVGSSIGAPVIDFNGNTRPSGGGYDIGAFEN